MNLPLIVLLVILVLAVGLILRLRRGSGSAPSAAPTRPKTPVSAYHAVSIKLSDYPCTAARELAGQRFLSSEAPKLPLANCGNPAGCACRFVHHKDRRAGKDRRSPFGPAGFGAATGKFEQEQRKGADRRQSDEDDYF
jgi:hypothetical protein